MKHLKAIIIFGWAVPLLASIHLLSTKLSCISADMLCSFPLLDGANHLILVSFVWLIISVIVYIRTN